MTGYRTILFHVIMGLAGIVGLQIAPDTAQHWASVGVVVWMVGGVVLRYLTTTPMFRTLSPDAQRLAAEIAANCPTGDAPQPAVPQPLAADAPASGGATITGPPGAQSSDGGSAAAPPLDLVTLATSIVAAANTINSVHRQMVTSLQAANDQVSAALPAAVPVPQPQPQPAAVAVAAGPSPAPVPVGVSANA